VAPEELPMHLTRRDLIAGASASWAAVNLSGSADAQARRVLVITSNQDIPNFDPHLGTGYSTSMLLRNVYDSLVRVEGTPPKPVPHLAASWTVSPDGLEYTFKLDPAAKFTDGTPVTAEAVQYSLNRLIRLNRGNAWMVAGIVDASSVQVVDPQTVRIKLLKPFVAFLQVLPWIWVVNPAQVEANKGADDGQTYLRTNIAGSGAFQVRRAEPGNLYEFERIPTAWQAGGGNLTGAIWKITRETATQRLMLQRGEAHIAVDLTSEDMDALKGRPGVVLVVEPEYRTFSIKLNTRHGPLADPELRKAVSYAFNYQSMLDAAGYAKLMTGPLPEGIFGHDPALPVYRTDLAKAKEHLARSKFPNGGVKLTMVHVSGLDQQRRWALVLLDSLKALNIDLEIKPMIWPDMVASTRSPETTADFFPVYQTAKLRRPGQHRLCGLPLLAQRQLAEPGLWQSQGGHLIETARAETDEAKRKALYGEFQKTVVEDAPDIFGVLENRKLAMRADVQNFQFTPVASNAIELFPLSLKG
jgi:peptide/nickel transport system substrate-binding protein